MSPYDAAMLVLAASGSIIAIAALLTVRGLDRLEREIAERKAAKHAAE
ncbi:MAG: hypothetical protein ABL883_04300 [Terricaulis sp.]